MDSFLRDLRHGLRLLRREKAFSATVLLTLALSIGANTAIFSVVDTVLLRPLPYPQPDRLVILYNSYPGAGAERGGNSAPDFFFRRERVDAFANVAAFQGWGYTVGEAGSTERLASARVTSTLFPLLGVSPVLGRNFTEDEMAVGHEPEVILSYDFWMERYDGDRTVLGRSLRVDGRPYMIVGVLPERFRMLGTRQPRFYVPIPFTDEDHTAAQLHNNNYQQIARLRAGATVAQAASQIEALNAAVTEEWPVPNGAQLLKDAGFRTVIRPLKDDLLRDVKPILLLLWAGVAFVLVIGCVNIANLMLARSHLRMREMATRMALGAARARLGRQLVTESLVMGVLGGGFGIAVGALGLRLLETVGLQELPRGTDVSLDLTAVLFTLALGVGAGLVFGAIPLVHVARSDLNVVFRAGGRTGTASHRALLLRNALVTGQVALSFVLLIGAGLMLGSFRALLHVDPGFEPEGVLTGQISLPSSRYPNRNALRLFVEDLLPKLRALPGVEHASVTSQLPFSGNRSTSVILPEAYTPEPGESLLSPLQNRVGTDYFRTMGIPLLEGRTFEASDDEDHRNVIILDQWLAHRYFPDGDALGKRMLWGTVPGMEEDEEPFLYTVVGVVGSVKQSRLDETGSVGAYYMPAAQQPFRFLKVAVRTRGEPTALVEPVRRSVAQLDPELPFYGARTMRERITESMRDRRAVMLLMGVFSVLALVLAAVGIYGALAYSVAVRTRELGIRMALGSSGSDLFRLVVGQGGAMVLVGLAAGAGAAALLVRLVRSLLYGVQPTDPYVLASAAFVLAATGLLACALPARRAARTDPVQALSRE